MWCEPIAALVWTPLHCEHKTTPGALKRCGCSVETQKRIKEFSKWKKPHQTWMKHSQINKSSPCLLYCCRTSPFVQQSLSSPLAEPHAGPLLIPAELWQVFSSFLAAPALLVLRTSWELGALPSKAIPYFGKDRALSIQWDAPEQETLARTPQPHKPLQPNTCNQQSSVPQLPHHPS